MSEDTRTLTVTIPLQLDRRVTPNGRPGHWGVRKRLTDEMQRTTQLAMLAVIDPNDPVQCFQTARWPLTLDYEIRHGKRRRKMDEDNAIASMKPVQDAIATALGIDDRNFRFGSMTQTRDETGRGCIIVVITEAKAP